MEPMQRRPDSISEDCYWLRGGLAETPLRFRGTTKADVVVVGGGFTGLWTAIRLHEADPSLRIALVEQARIGFGASGRNGGYVDATLTHGLSNGMQQFPDEWRDLDREGVGNLREIVTFIKENKIDCDLELTGRMTLASEEYQARELAQMAALANDVGVPLEYKDKSQVHDEIRAGNWIAGLRTPPTRSVMVDPAKLCWALRDHAKAVGIEIYEDSRVTKLQRRAGHVRVHVADGWLDADRVVVATGAYSGWLPSLQLRFVPLFDYALVTQRLTDGQLDYLGWQPRQGLRDAWNWFHYFRLTPDNRLLFGGYQAVYYFGSHVSAEQDLNPRHFGKLERHMRTTFPGLGDVSIDFRWGGPIDSTSRYTMSFPTLWDRRVIGAIGYTGLGVSASRWAAGVVRDMIVRPDSGLLQLKIVRTQPLPFPPEPFRYLGVEAVRLELARADRRQGRRGLILRVMDRAGIGIAS
jgi:glycine/D-amino acid oxidase-like deaminating enzyme